VNTKVLATGCVVALSLLVSGTSAQIAQTGAPRPQATPAAPAAPAAQSAQALPDAAAQRKMLDQYCVGCHNEDDKVANLLLDKLDVAHLAANAEVGEKVIRKLRAGLMPPSGMPRPTPAAMESLIRGMESQLDKAAVANLTAPGIHRLNRTEYANAIRDLLALEVDATKFLPSDDSTR